MQRALIAHNCECDVWGLGHENYSTTPDYESYDVIINLENYDTGWMPNLAHIKKPLKLLWAIDSHVRGYEYYANVYQQGKYRYILQASKPYLDANSLWFPNCYDHEFIKPLPNIQKTVLAGFCGNIVNRGPLLSTLSNCIPSFKLDIDVRGIKMIEAINSYKIQVNANISVDVNYRNFETLGCRTALVTSLNTQYEELGFKDRVHLFQYNSINEAIDLVRYLEKNPALIESSAQAGYELVLKKHTFFKRAESLLKFINTL